MRRLKIRFRKKLLKRRFRRAKNSAGEALTGGVAKLSTINPLSPTPEPSPSLEGVPRITTENVTEHREEVLSGARKYIYPLAHSKHRIVVITSTILGLAVAVFLIYCVVGLYRWYQYNGFLYRVTQVAPFPIARSGRMLIAYENYLFEVRQYTHYYVSQQQRNFNNPDDRQQLDQFRKQALADVINKAFIKKLAAENKVSVSGQEVDTRISEVRDQNRLGSNNKVFADVLRDYWGWSVGDFRRSLKDELLAEKLTAKLDTAASQRAADTMAQLHAGHDFNDLAKNVSDDSSKSSGGDYGTTITKLNSNLPPQIIDTLFKLKAGQVSDIINTGTTLEILRVNASSADGVTAQHIVFNLKDLNSTYLQPLEAKSKIHTYAKF